MPPFPDGLSRLDQSAVPELLKRISQAYAGAEDDRYTVERALETLQRQLENPVG